MGKTFYVDLPARNDIVLLFKSAKLQGEPGNEVTEIVFMHWKKSTVYEKASFTLNKLYYINLKCIY